MKKNFKYHAKGQYRPAFTLIECILTAVVLAIVMAGLIAFRYYTVVNIEQAENQLLAARCAYLLSEAWRGRSGDDSFDPLTLDFEDGFQLEQISSFEAASNASGNWGPTAYSPSFFNTLGCYQIQVEDKQFYAQLLYGKMLWYQDLTTIHIYITWKDHHGKRYEYFLPTLAQS